MIPPLIVEQAVSLGITLLAVTDHNATANIRAVQQAAKGYPLTILPGMEVQTMEEVHCLCLFDTLEQAQQWQKIVDESLPKLQNRPDFFGEQFIVDQTGEFVSRDDQLRAISVEISFDEACRQVQALSGLFIPAHINRINNGLIPILGFVPESVPVSALEISRHLTISQAREKFPQISHYPLVQNGDVHMLDSMLGANEFTIAEPTIEEIGKALRGVDSRSYRVRAIDK